MKNNKISSSEKQPASRLSPSTKAIVYAVIGGVWIIASDGIVKLISNEPITITHLQTLKGWLYVAVTALILYGLFRSFGNSMMRAMIKLKDSEERFRVLVEHAPEAILVYDVDRDRFVVANKNAELLFACSRDALLLSGAERFCGSVQPDGHPVRESMRMYTDQVLAGGEVRVDRAIRNTADRESICEVRLVRLPSADRKLIRASFIDITERARTEKTMRTIIEEASSKIGEEFFASMARQLAKALDADSTIIGEVIEGENVVRTIAVYQEGRIAENFIYKSADSPCDTVINKRMCSYASGVCDRFPKAKMLKQMEVVGYVGVPLFDSRNRTIGIMEAFYKRPVENVRFAEAILQIFSQRIASEIERQRVEESLRETRERFKNLVEASSDWVWEVDEHGTYTYASSKVRDILGYEPEEVMGKTPFELMPAEEAERVAALFSGIADSRKPFSLLEQVMLHKEGASVILETSGVPFFDAAGSLKGYRGIDRDITERKRAEETIRYQMYHDLLTGLPNRALYADLLEHEMLEMQSLGKKLAVLILDVDQFKNINDSFGHAAGDRLIQHIALELKNSIREFDTIARIGGDEFALLLPLIHRPEDVSRIVDKIMQSLKKPFIIDHHEIRSTVSIGISLFPEDGHDAASLRKNADIALHFAKDQGRDNYQFYNSSISHRTLERVIFENRLRQAVERGELVVHYQPQRNIKNGIITGAEALVRWKHPDLGMLPPAQFIPLAEETRLIVDIDQWVLDTVCKQLKIWEGAGHELPFVTVNLSARRFQQPDLAVMIGKMLEKTGIRPGNLGIEITETLAMRDTELTSRNLSRLNEMGVRLLIDDFGTGYSSLSYLKKLPIHKLKIDKSFITDLATDRDDQAITNAIVAMAHILNLKVVAEGVETKDQEAFLESRGCDEMQGFLFSEPVPAGEFEKLLVSAAGHGGLAA